MMKTKNILILILGWVLAMAPVLLDRAQAQTVKDGFYMRPELDILFVGEPYTDSNLPVAVGGGSVFTMGYNISNFQIELLTGYHYYGGQVTTIHNSGPELPALIRRLDPLSDDITLNSVRYVNDPNFVGSPILRTTLDTRESFIPLTLGLNYVIKLTDGGGFTMTPGIAGGIWMHLVERRNLRYSIPTFVDFASSVVRGLTLDAEAPAEASSDLRVRGLFVPSLAFDYRPTNDVALSFRTRFYIVPGGFSDHYGEELAFFNRTFERRLLERPSDGRIDDLFWYGTISFGVEYTF